MKTIYCIQPFSASGHHDAYADMYCKLLIELGYRVILIADGNRVNIAQELHAYGKKGLFYFFYRQSETVHEISDTPAKNCSKLRRIARICKIYLFNTMRYAFARIKIYIPPRKRRHIQDTLLTQGSIEEIRITTGYSPNHVFILYFDYYLHGEQQSLQNVPTPWTGLLFNAKGIKRGDYYLYKALSLPLCSGIAMFDPRYENIYKKTFPEKNFAIFPDVQNSDLTEYEPDWCGAIKDKAAGRTVVTLPGSLATRKGVITLLKVAYSCTNAPLFFVFCGPLSWDAFADSPAADRELLRAGIDSPPENCYFYLQYIENESERNHLFLISDIIFAVYEDFDLSSGTVGKAAVFGKPVLVQKGGLMERFVSKGPFGEAVQSGDVQAIIAALQHIRSGRQPYHFAQYAAEISLDRLRECLGSFMRSLEQYKDPYDVCPRP